MNPRVSTIEASVIGLLLVLALALFGDWIDTHRANRGYPVVYAGGQP